MCMLVRVCVCVCVCVCMCMNIFMCVATFVYSVFCRRIKITQEHSNVGVSFCSLNPNENFSSEAF